LNLDREKTKRIVFHEITKEAIQKAVKNPRFINQDLVNAQQARRVLDRLVGFELSPLLWKKIKPALSAGRVQSVTVKLIVEREREIGKFNSESSFRIIAVFTFQDNSGKTYRFSAELDKREKTDKLARQLCEKLINAKFSVDSVVKKPGKKSPAPPFTTSTLQQEASRKLGFSVAQTMMVAQKLYEGGKITYMRTDSVHLSESALNASAKQIETQFGKQYLETRHYKTKSKGAQEAHEAIRPTYMENSTVAGSAQEKRLYELIWKRTIASQMADAALEKTTIKVKNTNTENIFVATGEVIRFDGFLKVYMESSDDEESEEGKGLLPPLKENDPLGVERIDASEKYSLSPPRYTEASLVKKLEELGIGRPSTYAPTISTIQNREYVIKEDRPGQSRTVKVISLINNKISEQEKTEIYGNEKSKLFPTDIGIIVNDFLEQYFDEIMNFNFTASVEEEFDKIAEGKVLWTEMIDRFYKTFHSKIAETEKTGERSRGERILGNDPASGKPVSVKIGRYGPVVQIGTANDEEKPRFASLLKSQSLETLSLEEALELFKLPRVIGESEGSEMVAGIGRFGPYVRFQSKFYSIPKTDDPITITMDRAMEIIHEKQEKERNKQIKIFKGDTPIEILNGRYGPYIKKGDQNYRIPKGVKPEDLSEADCLKIIEESVKKPRRGKK
jgi:DNA topoisomerase I